MSIKRMVLAATLAFAGLIVPAAHAQIPENIETHLRAARQASKFEWVGTLSRDCVAPTLGPPELGRARQGTGPYALV